MKVDGREVQLTCEKEPPPGLAKKARLYLKSAAGLSMAIKVMDAAGEVLEQEVLEEGDVEVYANVEDLPPEPEDERSGDRAEDQTAGDGTLEEHDDLESRLIVLQKRIAGIEGAAAKKLLQALKVAAQLNAARKKAKSSAAMDQIEAALARVVGCTQPDDQKNDPTDAKALLARLNDLSGRIKALDDRRTDKLKEAMAKVGADPKVAKALEIVGVMQKRAEALSDSTARADFFENLSDARAKADAGDGDGALVALGALQAALKALETAPQDETTPEAAPSVADRVEERAPKPKSPLEYWNSGKATADEAISALQKSLKEIGDPDLDKIAEFGLHGLMDGHQVKLITALIDYSKSGADSRAKTAQKVIAQCKS